MTRPATLLHRGPRRYATAFLTLWISVEASGEQWVRTLSVRDWQLNRMPVRAALEVRSGREHLILRSLVLPHEATKVVQALPSTERPKCLFSKEESCRRVRGCGR